MFIKKFFALLLVVAMVSVSIPNQMFASATNFNIGDIEVVRTSDGTVVSDHSTGEIVSLKFTNASQTEGIWTDTDGTTKTYTKDSNGSVYLDGVMVVEAVKEKINNNDYKRGENLNTSAQYSYNYNWKYVTTYKTKQSLIDTANNVALGILSLFPYIGPIATIAGIIKTVQDSGKSEVYIKVDQYISGDYKWIKNNSYYYSDANYSKLIKSHMGGAEPSGY